LKSNGLEKPTSNMNADGRRHKHQSKKEYWCVSSSLQSAPEIYTYKTYLHNYIYNIHTTEHRMCCLYNHFQKIIINKCHGWICKLNVTKWRYNVPGTGSQNYCHLERNESFSKKYIPYSQPSVFVYTIFEEKSMCIWIVLQSEYYKYFFWLEDKPFFFSFTHKLCLLQEGYEKSTRADTF